MSFPKILYNPKSTFSEMRGYTGITEGLVAYLILFVISAIIFYIMSYTGVFAHFVTPLGAFYSTAPLYNFSLELLLSLLFIGAFMLLLISFVATHLAHFLFRKGTNYSVTVGFMGYTYFIDFIIGVIISLLMAMGFSAAYSLTYSGNILDISGIHQTTVLALLALTAFALIWKLYVGGYAISIANDISANSGVLIYLLSTIIVTIVIYILGLLLSSIPAFNILASTRAF